MIKLKVNCPKCDAELYLNEKTLEFRCQRVNWIRKGKKKIKQVCNVKLSGRVGTWFGGSKLSIDQIVHLTYRWITSKYTVHNIHFHTGVSKWSIID